MGGGEEIARKDGLFNRKQITSSEILEKSLVGKTIDVKRDGEVINHGKLVFCYMGNQQMNTGYYIEGQQIPLLSIKEVGEDYLRV